MPGLSWKFFAVTGGDAGYRPVSVIIKDAIHKGKRCQAAGLLSITGLRLIDTGTLKTE